jgi:hypothetical protein
MPRSTLSTPEDTACSAPVNSPMIQRIVATIPINANTKTIPNTQIAVCRRWLRKSIATTLLRAELSTYGVAPAVDMPLGAALPIWPCRALAAWSPAAIASARHIY